MRIALAWNVLKFGDREVVWKNGSASGCGSFVGFEPAARFGVIGLINVQSNLCVGDIATFVREGNRFFYLPTPGRKLELFAESDCDFFFKEADAQVTFEAGSTGPAGAAIWHQWGQVQRGERIP